MAKKAGCLIIIAFLVVLMNACVIPEAEGEVAIWVAAASSVKNKSAKGCVKWQPYDDGYILYLPGTADVDKLTVFVGGATQMLVGDVVVKSGKSTSAFSGKSDVIVTIQDIQYKLKIMKSSPIPALFLVTKSNNMRDIEQSDDHSFEEKGDMLLLSEKGDIQYNGALTQIRGRGNSTWTWDKKPYQIKLQNNTDLLGLGAHKTWVLLANYIDQSMLRNKIVYDFAAEIGLDNASKSQLVDLYTDGEYAGVYQLSEKVQIGVNRIDIKDLEENNEKINITPLEQFRRMGDTQGFEAGSYKWVELHSQPLDVTGGYLLEFDYGYRYEKEPSGFVTDRGRAIVIKSPEYASKAQVEYIRSYVQELEDAIYSRDGKNNKNKHYSEYINVNSLILQYFVDEIFMNCDAQHSSYYLYKNSDLTSDGRLYAGVPWDYDYAIGNRQSYLSVDMTDPSLFWNNKIVLTSKDDISWIGALFEHTDFLEQLTETYNNVIYRAFEQLISTDLNEHFKDLQAAADMNFTRWDTLGEYLTDVKTGDTWQENCEYILNFLTRRKAFMDSTIALGIFE